MKRTFIGLSLAAMLLQAPPASAYWTGHAEVIKDIFWTWVGAHMGGAEATRNSAQPPVKSAQPTGPVSQQRH